MQCYGKMMQASIAVNWSSLVFLNESDACKEYPTVAKLIAVGCCMANCCCIASTPQLCMTL